MSDLMMDLRLALRGLVRRASFTVLAVGTLALGIGASTAVFSVVDGTLLQPLPYENPQQLLLLRHAFDSRSGEPQHVPAPDVAEYRARSSSFVDFAFVFGVRDRALRVGASEAFPARVASVDPEFFEVVGVSARFGRLGANEVRAAPAVGSARPIGSDQEVEAADEPTPAALVLSDGLWRDLFGGDEAILDTGRTDRAVSVDGRVVFPVGVLPAGFVLRLPPDAGLAPDVDAWLLEPTPLAAFQRDEGRMVDEDSDNAGLVIARLAPGVSHERGRAELATIAAALRQDIPGYRAAGLRVVADPLKETAVHRVRAPLLVLSAAVALVLLIACANVAILLLTRATGRLPELATRAALGASRGQLARLLLVESALLAAAGGVLGTLLAVWATPLLLSSRPAGLHELAATGIDANALGFAFLVSAGSALLFGLAPLSILGERDLDQCLRSGGRTGTGGGHARARSVLVAAQVTLSVTLLVAAGLLLRTLAELGRVEPGFDARGVVAFDLGIRGDSYRGPADRARFARTLVEELEALPGVEAVGLSGRLPLRGETWTQPYRIGGPEPAAATRRAGFDVDGGWANFRVVTSGYFRAMGTRLLRGRFFTPHEDLQEDERVAIVDDALATPIAPDGDALGMRIWVPVDGAWVEARIVGVVETVRHDSLRDPGRGAVYVPYRQEASRNVGVVARTSGDPAALVETLRRRVRALDPGLPVFEPRLLEQHLREATAPTRFTLWLLGAFAGVALALASIGIYGQLSYSVGRQRRDIGIRMALGARPPDVVRGVVSAGLVPVALGLGIGLLMALAVSRVLSSLLYEVRPFDPLTYVAVLGGFACIGALACLVPARRATAIDPVEVLRHG